MYKQPCVDGGMPRPSDLLEQGSGSIDGVEVAVRVDSGRSHEPDGGLVVASKRLENVGVGVPQPRGTGPRMTLVQPPACEHGKGCVELAEITARSRDHDQQLDASLRVQAADIWISEIPSGLRGSAERSFAVGEQWQIARVT